MIMLEILKQATVIPVIIIDSVDHAVPLAQALHAGGIKTLEITLRTPVALHSIKQIAQQAPQVMVGAGTILQPAQFAEAKAAGAKFAVSPGILPSLVDAARAAHMPYLPGAATATELMQVLQHGFKAAKFFPVCALGGVSTVTAMASIFPQLKLCVTGGVTLATVREYLELDPVVAVGGSWMVPRELIRQQNWSAITELAQETMAICSP
jgi:2-dehydro-3-deoxyphosphogluconate aldolase/(4S)-4-hydroxy-2-oxoglutarate aldolase